MKNVELVLSNALLMAGFEEDKFGHYQKTSTLPDDRQVELRVKLQKTSFRVEFKNDLGEWRNLSRTGSCRYYKDLTLGEVRLVSWIKLNLIETR